MPCAAPVTTAVRPSCEKPLIVRLLGRGGSAWRTPFVPSLLTTLVGHSLEDNDTIRRSPMHDGLVLWTGTVRSSSFADRVSAAAEAGYSALSLSPHDYAAAGAD